MRGQEPSLLVSHIRCSAFRVYSGTTPPAERGRLFLHLRHLRGEVFSSRGGSRPSWQMQGRLNGPLQHVDATSNEAHI
jgi:hypothetical protein